jgi:anti-sigma regulatory factor (Ser/Thr protein kinase)
MGMAVPPINDRPTQPSAERRGLRLELERSAEAPAVARAAVTGLCSGAGLDLFQRAELILLVSEVVTNAVVHSNAPPTVPIALEASLTAETVRVEVTDAGRGFVPPVERARADGGYGFYLLDQAASRWGVDREGGSRVWFELSRSIGIRRVRYLSVLD